MLTKKLLISCLTALLLWNVSYAQSLERCKTTNHFTFHFAEMDDETMASITEELENFYNEMAEEFSFSSAPSLSINIYPNISSFHEALGLNEAPSWSVARATSTTIDIVSPTNPGPAHSRESMQKIMKLNIVKALLFQKFGQDTIPYWLAYGIGAVKAQYGNTSYPLTHIPTLEELERADYKAFNKIGGFQASYKFVEFIQERFGWDTLIDLLSDYNSHKEPLYQDWINSLPAL